MPYRWATEYVCDTLSASKTYAGKSFTRDMTLKYFKKHCSHYYMTRASVEYITYCLDEYAKNGWKNLKRKNTFAKYQEITSKYPNVEIVKELRPGGFPSLSLKD